MLRRVALRDYRNITEAQLGLGERFTVLVGRNGAGKTNVLEAIYFVSTLRSFRVSELGPLVRDEQPAARIEVEVDDAVAGVPTRLVVRLERRGASVRRTAEADGKTVRRAADFYGRVRAILFTPEDLAVIRGGPQGRRQVLDRMVFARDRAHIGDTQAYDKVVRSRNHVLKQEISPVERDRLLESYDAQLVEVGTRLWTRRCEMVEEVAPLFEQVFARIHGTEASAAVRYLSRLEEREGPVRADARATALAAAVTRRRPDDLQRRVTTVGPHRDDLSITLDGHAASSHASQGQTRALMLALKLAELRAARIRGGEAPLLLLDDVSSELDAERTEQLFAALSEDAGQCLLTTTEDRLAALAAGPETRRFRVVSGVVEGSAQID